MKNINGISINDLIDMNLDDHDTEVFNIIKKTTDYEKYSKDIETVLEYLKENNREYRSILDSAIAMNEGIIKNVAFEQGFKTAIKLIFSSLS